MSEPVKPTEEVKEQSTRKLPVEALFLGGNNYVSPTEHFPYGGYRSEGKVKVLEEKPGSKHPYRIKPVRGTSASGWVDADKIKF